MKKTYTGKRRAVLARYTRPASSLNAEDNGGGKTGKPKGDLRTIGVSRRNPLGRAPEFCGTGKTSRFEYFRLTAQLQLGKASLEDPLAAQDRFDNHFLDSPEWRAARATA